MKEMKVTLKGLTCANCAGKIETVLAEMAETEAVSINLMKQELTLTYGDAVSAERMQDVIEKTVHRFEPEVGVLFADTAKKEATCCGAEGCGCGMEHACSCGHIHEGERNFGKRLLLRFGAGLLLFFAALMVQAAGWKTILFLGAYLVFGYDVLLRAVRNIRRGQVFDENFLMSVSTIGAFAIGEAAEAVFVMLFYQVGEAFQSYAVERSRKSITALLEIRPDFARVLSEKGAQEMPPEQVRVGDVLLVKAGERIPLDGMILEGEALLDTAALTGEALPRRSGKGDFVHSGCID
ncbi:MAG: heavy metal translocating P-type ATPase, partial [Bacillota bacterium]|nr:heavy metal translocating P-type ATPase [Bacillota bacterium]